MYEDPSGYNAQSKCPEPGEPEEQKKQPDDQSSKKTKTLSEWLSGEQ
jgi:hypothetical protein